jgi:hypothetical protein
VGAAGVVVVGVVPLAPGAAAPLGAAVPCGYRTSVKRVPSAVFTSVTGLFTESVRVCEPLAYEPPTTETVADFAVSETSWNRPFELAFGFETGKFPRVLTISESPFTEITAELGGGLGGAGGTGGTAGGETGGVPGELPAPVPPDAGADPPPPANGSLLSKRENDSS